jgi:hypothetical protein
VDHRCCTLRSITAALASLNNLGLHVFCFVFDPDWQDSNEPAASVHNEHKGTDC